MENNQERPNKQNENETKTKENNTTTKNCKPRKQKTINKRTTAK